MRVRLPLGELIHIEERTNAMESEVRQGSVIVGAYCFLKRNESAAEFLFRHQNKLCTATDKFPESSGISADYVVTCKDKTIIAVYTHPYLRDMQISVSTEIVVTNKLLGEVVTISAGVYDILKMREYISPSILWGVSI